MELLAQLLGAYSQFVYESVPKHRIIRRYSLLKFIWYIFYNVIILYALLILAIVIGCAYPNLVGISVCLYILSLFIFLLIYFTTLVKARCHPFKGFPTDKKYTSFTKSEYFFVHLYKGLVILSISCFFSAGILAFLNQLKH